MAHALERFNPYEGQSGEIYGYLFENTNTGLPRGLYFNLYIKLKPITYCGETWEPAVLVDWLSAAALRRPSIGHGDVALAEGSFYVGWHDPLTAWRIALEHDAEGWPTRAAFELEVNYSGYDSDPEPRLRIAGSSALRMTDIQVSTDTFDPAPRSYAEARAMLAPHFPEIRDWIEIPERDANGDVVQAPQMFRFGLPA